MNRARVFTEWNNKSGVAICADAVSHVTQLGHIPPAIRIHFKGKKRYFDVNGKIDNALVDWLNQLGPEQFTSAAEPTDAKQAQS